MVSVAVPQSRFVPVRWRGAGVETGRRGATRTAALCERPTLPAPACPCLPHPCGAGGRPVGHEALHARTQGHRHGHRRPIWSTKSSGGYDCGSGRLGGLVREPHPTRLPPGAAAARGGRPPLRTGLGGVLWRWQSSSSSSSSSSRRRRRWRRRKKRRSTTGGVGASASTRGLTKEEHEECAGGGAGQLPAHAWVLSVYAFAQTSLRWSCLGSVAGAG